MCLVDEWVQLECEHVQIRLVTSIRFGVLLVETNVRSNLRYFMSKDDAW